MRITNLKLSLHACELNFCICFKTFYGQYVQAFCKKSHVVIVRLQLQKVRKVPLVVFCTKYLRTYLQHFLSSLSENEMDHGILSDTFINHNLSGVCQYDFRKNLAYATSAQVAHVQVRFVCESHSNFRDNLTLPI